MRWRERCDLQLERSVLGSKDGGGDPTSTGPRLHSPSNQRLLPQQEVRECNCGCDVPRVFSQGAMGPRVLIFARGYGKPVHLDGFGRCVNGCLKPIDLDKFGVSMKCVHFGGEQRKPLGTCHTGTRLWQGTRRTQVLDTMGPGPTSSPARTSWNIRTGWSARSAPDSHDVQAQSRLGSHSIRPASWNFPDTQNILPEGASEDVSKVRCSECST